MWSRMLVLLALVALLVGGAPSAGAAASGAASPPARRGSWTWPVSAPHVLARGYLPPSTAYGPGHRGIDIRAPAAAPVLAPDDGVVHFSGFVVDRPLLSITLRDGVLASFEPVTTVLVAGETVARGQVVGTLVDGHCASPCLHLGARIDGEYVNPLLYLGGVPWSVLLPTG